MDPTFLERVPTTETAVKDVTDLLIAQATAISTGLRDASATDVDRAARLIVASPCVLVTGAGKSGCVARLFADLLLSAGFRAFFVHPSDARHGGLAVFRPSDLVILVSKSGDTEEIIELAKISTARGCLSLAITENSASELVRWTNAVILAPATPAEICPTGLIPVTSTSFHTAFLNVIVARVAQLANLSRSNVIEVHPAGYIGTLNTT